MKKRFAVLLLSAAIGQGVGMFAQASPGAGPTDPGASTPPAGATPYAPTTLRIRGTIEKFDPSTRILSVTTTNGTVPFALASTTRVRRGATKTDPQTLETLTGYRAAVRYSESGGIKTAESVHVFGRGERTER